MQKDCTSSTIHTDGSGYPLFSDRNLENCSFVDYNFGQGKDSNRKDMNKYQQSKEKLDRLFPIQLTSAMLSIGVFQTLLTKISLAMSTIAGPDAEVAQLIC